jgi:hypothetical protein
MQLIAPEIVVEGRGLSAPLGAAGFAVGLLLWLTGWWGHRFWIVLLATVTAGVLGLLKGPVYQVQPLVAALLLAVAAGVLALALVRLVAFAAGGVAAWLGVHALGPASWQEPLVCFLAGGLVGLLLFRVWTMILTSFGGAVLMTYFGLWFADQVGKLDAVAVANQRAALLNWVCAGTCVVGFVAQVLVDRRRVRRLREERDFHLSERALKKWYDQRRWWRWGRRLPYRRAG